MSLNYLWDFGDGQTSKLADPVHTYAAAGTYTVTLTISNETQTSTKIKTDYIVVTTPTPIPPGAFVYDTFTDVSGTPIVDHSPELGGPWTEADGERHMVANGTLMGIERSGSDVRIIPTAAVSGNWYFETQFTVLALNNNAYIQAYQNSDQNYLFSFDPGTGAIETWLETFDPGWVIGQTYVIRFEFTGSTCVVKLDGVTIITDNGYPFSPTGVISFDLWNGFPVAVGDPPLTIVDVDQQYDPLTPFFLDYVLMAAL